eukprot:341565_1
MASHRAKPGMYKSKSAQPRGSRPKRQVHGQRVSQKWKLLVDEFEATRMTVMDKPEDDPTTKDADTTGYATESLSAAKAALYERNRKRAIVELLSTEKNYIYLLTKLVEHYLDKLKEPQYRSVLSVDDYNLLFPSDLRSILLLNQTFYQDLKKMIKTGSFAATGTDLNAFVSHFLMYAHYCNNYSAAATRLAELRSKSSAFSKFCDKQCGVFFNNLSLEQLLILPIQRMPRYKLLLTEIVKFTPQNHPNLQLLKQALADIAKVNDSINDGIKDFESRIEVQNIENRLKINLVTPARRYIKQGQLCKIEMKDDQMYYLFILFNDCLLYASQSMIGSKLILGKILEFNEKFSVKETSTSINVHGIKNLFEIHSTTESFFVFAGSKKEMDDWIDAINKSCTEVMSRKMAQSGNSNLHAATLFIPDDFADRCMMKGCESRFTFVNRRHHCYSCGFVICGACSCNKVIVKSSEQLLRVCDACYKMKNRVMDQFVREIGDIIVQRKGRRKSTWKQKGYDELLVTGYLRECRCELPLNVIYLCNIAYGSIKKQYNPYGLANISRNMWPKPQNN